MRRHLWVALVSGLSLVAGCHKAAFHHQEGSRDICIVTQYTANQDEFADIARDNQALYAKHHGYHAFAFRGRISGDQFLDPQRGDEDHIYGGGLYWQKLVATQHVLALRHDDGTPVCSWAMWVDADIVFSNFNKRLEREIATYAPTEATHVILSREEAGAGGVLINSGAYFIRNSPAGLAFLQRVGDRYPEYKDHRMPEQDAIQDDAFNTTPETPLRWHWAHVQTTQRPDVAVAPQRAFNSFERPKKDPPEARWQPCDLVAHLSGQDGGKRVRGMLRVIATLHTCPPEDTP